MIHLHDVCFSYGDQDPVLQNLNLEIQPGLTLLLGPNGCGKSTLLKLIAGVEFPGSGSIEIAGYDLWKEEVAARQALAFVPEQPDLTPYAAVKDVIMLVCRLRRELPAVGRDVLKKVGLENLSHRSIRELSMGQRRRVVLAAAWIGSPSIILLDEPLESMDRAIRESILLWIDGQIERNATIVVVTHEIEPFVMKAARAITIHAGRCAVIASIPPTPEKRLEMLDRLSRGLLP
jgi:ABC-type multidrug transport system ATPase subunit